MKLSESIDRAYREGIPGVAKHDVGALLRDWVERARELEAQVRETQGSKARAGLGEYQKDGGMGLSEAIRQVRRSAQDLGVYQPMWHRWEDWIILAARQEREIGDLRTTLATQKPEKEQSDE